MVWKFTFNSMTPIELLLLKFIHFKIEKEVLKMLFWFFAGAVLGFELRASHWLARWSTI
jgi:hypothetical protein